MTAGRSSIQRRMIALMMIATACSLVVAGAAFLWYDTVSFRENISTALRTRASILAANSTAALSFQNPEDAASVLAALETDPHTVAAALYDEHGRLFATYPRTPSQGTVPAIVPPLGSRFETSALIVALPVTDLGRDLGTMYLRSDLEGLHRRQRDYALVVLAATLGALAVAFLLSSWLQKSITHPIRALSDAARRVSEHEDYAVRVPVGPKDELGLLTESFNTMLTEIEGRDLEIRRLNADLERRVALRTAELESTNRELEAFSYSVSHDLRAPVRHIAGFADLLGKRTAGQLDEAASHYLGNIVDSGRRMGQLIDDLLMFSRMGRAELKASEIALDPLVADVIRELAPDLVGRTVKWDIGALPTVKADPAMLRMALTNLLSNAVKYTSPREVARIVVRADTQAGEVTVSVGDNGVGFDMAYGAKLFGVFQRLHGADEFEGTGIGLANVRRIITRHGGRTWADGELDRGATFYFSLPAEAEAA